MRWMAMLILMGCGGAEPVRDTLDGCWNYQLSEGANASGQMQIAGRTGTFTLQGTTPLPDQPASGLLLASQEPNGDIAFLFYTEANRFLLQVVNDQAAITGLATPLHFTRSRCQASPRY